MGLAQYDELPVLEAGVTYYVKASNFDLGTQWAFSVD